MWLDPETFAGVVKTTLEYRAACHPGPGGAHFDFAASGDTRGDSGEQARSKVAAFEAAGATWWIEWLDDRVGTYEAALEHIRRRPADRRG